jgi:hypothetical protein
MRACDLTTQEYCDGFLDFIFGEMVSKGVITPETKMEDIWEEAQYSFTKVQGPEGSRCDLILIFKPDAKINIGRMAMLKIALPDVSWIEDWLVNDATLYHSSPRGPHAAAAMRRSLGVPNFDFDEEE